MREILIPVTQLNDSNYPEWAIRMEAILVREDLWPMVEISVNTEGKTVQETAVAVAEEKAKRAKDKMAWARAEMILRVEDNQLVHMMSTDPMEIWQILRCVHRAASFATSLSLRRKFLTAKKSDSQTMQSWIGYIQGLAFRMENANIAIINQDKILAITMGLPPSYDNVIINFDSMSPDTLTLNLVITCLLNEEVWQTTLTLIKQEDHGDKAMAVFRTREIVCYFCDAKGHYKSDCPEKKAWEKSKAKKGVVAAAAWDSSDDEAFLIMGV